MYASIKELAEYYQVSYKTIYRLVTKNDIPGTIKVGTIIRVDTDAFQDFLETRTEKK